MDKFPSLVFPRRSTSLGSLVSAFLIRTLWPALQVLSASMAWKEALVSTRTRSLCMTLPYVRKRHSCPPSSQQGSIRRCVLLNKKKAITLLGMIVRQCLFVCLYVLQSTTPPRPSVTSEAVAASPSSPPPPPPCGQVLDFPSMTDEEVLASLLNGKIKDHELEKKLKDYQRSADPFVHAHFVYLNTS